MVLPATYISALLVLIGAVLCFSFWPNLYKKAEAGWRFELFSLDFGIGALVFAAIAAYTFGTFGPEMTFNDRLLIAGRSAGLWVFATGAIWALGNLLLLVSTSLLGMSAAFPISFGMAAILIGATHFRFLRPAWAALGIGLLAFAAIGAAVASRVSRSGSRVRSWRRGIGLSIAAGIPFAIVQWMLRHTADPEFGPGPYATTLLFALGFLVLTPAYNFFLMHIKIVGNPIGFGHFRLGGLRFHFPGVLAGVVWSLGLLLFLLALGISGESALSPAVCFSAPLFSVSICCLFALFRWQEYRTVPSSARALLLFCAACFAAGSISLGLSYIN